MALESKEKIISGKSVKSTQLPAEFSNQLFPRVIKYFGAGILQAVDQIKALVSTVDPKAVTDGSFSFLSLNINWTSFAGIVNEFASKLTPEEWQDFCMKMLAYTDVNGKRITDSAAFNEAFSGKLLFMCKAIVFSLEVNFGDFLEESGIGPTSTPPTPTPEKSAQ